MANDPAASGRHGPARHPLCQPRTRAADYAVGAADPAQGRRLGGFLRERPSGQIKPGIVPKIGDQPWAHEVFNAWYAVIDVSPPVKKAITQQRGKGGNVRV